MENTTIKSLCYVIRDGAPCECPRGWKKGCMRLAKRKQPVTVASDNVERLKTYATKKLQDTPYYTLLQVLAEACDLNAGPHNCYATLGCTKAQDSLIFTVSLDGDKDPIYAVRFEDIATDSAAFLDRPE